MGNQARGGEVMEHAPERTSRRREVLEGGGKTAHALPGFTLPTGAVRSGAAEHVVGNEDPVASVALRFAIFGLTVPR